MRECSHGIVVGTCNFCMAESLKVEQNAIEDIRVSVRATETRVSKTCAEAKLHEACAVPWCNCRCHGNLPEDR